MRQLADALQRAMVGQDTELGKMVQKASLRAKPKPRRVKKKITPAQAYVAAIRRSEREGWRGAFPCSLLSWKPGRPAKVRGNTCQVKWGLKGGEEEWVVVLYDQPQEVAGLEEKSYYALVLARHLQECDCRGYLHAGVCKPTRTKLE